MMETARRTAAPEVDRRQQERAAKEATDKEIAARVSSPPEPPTPTQAEADAFKEGAPPDAPAGDTAAARRTP
jgi:hypothetical protein